MSDLSCFWKVHTFLLIAVYQQAPFCLWIQRWSSSFVSAQADVLETTRLICEDGQSSSAGARGRPLPTVIIFWDGCLLALFYTAEQEGRLSFSTLFTSAFENTATLGQLNGDGKQPQYLCVEKSTENPFFQRSTLSFLITNTLSDVEFQLTTKH